eukprot:GHVU01041768.1.p1 GENE.GHVU01041768.1~~GHVU01041768.1.p1  ORF type:complete len:659 (-),score=111.12 GHVU01041768.1:170-2035(-)
MEEGQVGWFLNGKLNVCDNCVDRWAETDPNRIALIWESDDPRDSVRITYQQLLVSVCKCANMLKKLGVKKQDRVAVYMPMIPEAVYAMLACARIGAIHNVVFAGFSAANLRDRIIDSGARVVVTANEGIRGGKVLHLKAIVDEALEGTEVEKCVVFRRTDTVVPMRRGRDVDGNEIMRGERPYCPIEHMDSEDLLFILYTSGSTGSPKGIAHTSGGYLLYTAITHEFVFDYHPGDVYACVADIGWITGHSYVVYGPLCNGATSVLFESVPTYPDPGRYWSLVERHRVSQLYTAPTAIRALMCYGDEIPQRYDLSSLRILGTVGEPINPEAWRWYHSVVGGGRCDIIDTYWQTETGGHVITPVAGATAMKPGSASLPFFGVEPAIVHPETGKELHGAGVMGILCFKRSWPGMMRTIYGDHQRFIDTYLSPYPGWYFTGDGAMRDADGFYWITGRIDDTINVAGHRIGTAEVEHALSQHPGVAESAVVGFPNIIKGSGLCCYVILMPSHASVPEEEILGELKSTVRKYIGPIATPDRIVIVESLPKTRSGKILRRILRNVAMGVTDIAAVGDVSTLADPGAVANVIERFGAKSSPRHQAEVKTASPEKCALEAPDGNRARSSQ